MLRVHAFLFSLSNDASLGLFSLRLRDRRTPRSRSTARQVAVFALHRRTLRRTVGTKDAAVASLGAQQRLTASTLVEKLAGLGRHRFPFGEAANGAHQH
jgi:hypothetical protein